MAFLSLIDTQLHSFQLEVHYDVVTKALDTELFPQNIIADLNSGITFIVLFNQEKPLR